MFQCQTFITMHHQWRIQVLRLWGAHFFWNYNCTPLESFSWSHYKCLYLILFKISNCTPPPFEFFFLKPLSKSILCISSEATIKIYTWICLGFRIAPPPWVFFPGATIKIYTVHFFCSHYKSLYLEFYWKGGPGPSDPAPGSALDHNMWTAVLQWTIMSIDNSYWTDIVLLVTRGSSIYILCKTIIWHHAVSQMICRIACWVGLIWKLHFVQVTLSRYVWSWQLCHKWQPWLP